MVFIQVINRAPIMCRALRNDVACAPELQGAHRLWKILGDQQSTLILQGTLRPREVTCSRLHRVLVADSWLEARSLYSQFGIFLFDYCEKCLAIVRKEFKTRYN